MPSKRHDGTSAQIKGETQPVKKILPRLSGFIPFSWLNFIFLAPSRTALGLSNLLPADHARVFRETMKVQVRWDTIYRNSLHNPQNHNIAFRSASVLGKRLFALTERVLPTKRGTPRHAALFEALEGSCCYHLLKSPHHCFSSRFRGLMSSPLQYNTCLGTYRRSGAPEKYPSNP